MHRQHCLVGVWLAVACATALAEPVSFARKPTAIKADGGVKIEFAARAATDVAVWVEDSGGRVVRHLAAGALGDNAPGPLTKSSLAQAIIWDGRDDDGRAATGGPFKVRVGLGLTAGYAGTAFGSEARPDNLAGVAGLRTTPAFFPRE